MMFGGQTAQLRYRCQPLTHGVFNNSGYYTSEEGWGEWFIVMYVHFLFQSHAMLERRWSRRENALDSVFLIRCCSCWHDTHTHTRYTDDSTMCHSTRRMRDRAGDVGYMCTDEASWKNRGSFFSWLWSMKPTCQRIDLLRDLKLQSIVTWLIIGRNIWRQLSLLSNYRHIPCIFFSFFSFEH